MRRFLIDHQGKTWTYPAEGLGEALGYPKPDFDVWSYAIRNLGAVEIAVEDERTTVCMRSATARGEAVRAAELFLASLGPQPVRLRYEIGTWIEETCEGPDQAIGRMASALEDAARESRRMAFVAKARKLDMLAEMRLNHIETGDEKLGLIFKKWRLANGNFDSEMTMFLVRFGLLDRLAIAQRAPTDGDLYFSHIGAGLDLYNLHDNSWTFATLGARVEDQPDPDYGRWIGQTYRGVISENRPRFDYVDAVVQPPGGQPYRSRYDRLLLPWRTTDGSLMVTVSSYKTGSQATILQ